VAAVKVLAVVHQRDAGPGVFAEVIAGSGLELDRWCPPEQAEPPPFSDYGAVISFGGDAHPDQDSERPWLVRERALLREQLKAERPVLGVCLGAELLAQAAGAAVRRASRPEIGFHPVQMTDAGARDMLLGGIPARFRALSWHSYQCELPITATALARSDAGIQAFRIGSLAWGIQFHAEVTEADFSTWLDDFEDDPDAHVINPEELRAELNERIGDWNELGRAMCTRFLAAAELV
jgi:GMP synthase-like glutamine amidotransferase